jgi:hypothetical protein
MDHQNLSVADEGELRKLAQQGEVHFVSRAHARLFFDANGRWPSASVVSDPKDSAMRLSYLSQSIGLVSSYREEGPFGWTTVAELGNIEALVELNRITKDREEAFEASLAEDKAMWSGVGDILSDTFNGDDLVADIAGDLSTRSVGEVVDEWIEKAITEAETAIVNLIVED